MSLGKGLGALESWQSLLAAALAVAGLLNTCPAAAEPAAELLVATDYRSSANVEQVSVTWPVDAPAWLRAERLNASIGSLASSEDTRAYLSLAPVWRLNDALDTAFVEFSIGPALLAGSTLGDHDLGGNFHFLSSLAVGKTFGARGRQRLALRISHLSNGGLRGTNPGLDTVGISFTGAFGET